MVSATIAPERGADTGGGGTRAFLYGDDFHQLRIKQEAALVVEGGGVGIGVVYFEVDLVLTQTADVDPLRCAVAAAEADGGFVKQQAFQGRYRCFRRFSASLRGGWKGWHL